MGLRDAVPLAVIKVLQKQKHHRKLSIKQQINVIKYNKSITTKQWQCETNRNAMELEEEEEEDEEAEEKYLETVQQQQNEYDKEQFHTYFSNGHNQHSTLVTTIKTIKVETLTCSNGKEKWRKRSRTKMHNALKCFKKCLTALCFVCLFVSTITPTITPTKTTTTTRLTTTNTLTATILSLTSVLLHVPFIAASSLRTKSEQHQQQQQQKVMDKKNYDVYFERPWTESQVNGELGVEVEVDTFTESTADMASIDVVVNDMERQSTSNEEQLLAYYKRAQQQQQQQQKQMQNHLKISSYDFDELVTKRAATKRSIATMSTIISAPLNATKTSKEIVNMTTSVHATNLPLLLKPSTTTINTEFFPSYKSIESLSSVIADGELVVQESMSIEDKCEPKVLNSVPMEPVSF